jgi:L-rhamnose mutarotase
MDLKRELMIRRIKEGCMEAYLEKHNNYWPELKKEMLEGGFKNITCFVDGYNLFVYREYDEKVMELLPKDYFKYNTKWAEVMTEVLEPICIRGKEVFHLGNDE